MFMTRMALDVNRSDTQQAISNPALLQTAVENAFAGVKVHTVWRLEQLNHRLHIIMLSALRPTLGPAHQQYGYPGAFPSWETWSIDDELEGLYTGQKLHFRLCAGTCLPMDQQESVQHMAHETTALQLDWLRTHCTACGFTFDENDVQVLHSEWITWSEEGSDQMHTVHQATFDGILTVTDADALTEAIQQGIGDYVGMGAGLITLDPVQNFRYV